MAKARFLPLAEADLVEIWEYTKNTWSAAQADAYVEAIFDAADKLANRPAHGVPVDTFYLVTEGTDSNRMFSSMKLGHSALTWFASFTAAWISRPNYPKHKGCNALAFCGECICGS